MTDLRLPFLIATIGAGVAMGLLLPGSPVRARWVAAALGAASLGTFASQLPGLADWVAQSLFWILAGVTVVSGACAVSFRNPVYCAIWFGMTLVGTSGLLLFQGAQFLAVAVLVVYAGAILVMFLFVLMLAEPSGRAPYDRASWEAVVSAISASCLVGILSLTVTGVLTSRTAPPSAAGITPQARQQLVLADKHVQQIGGVLFGRYAVAVEVVGVLLLAALVGAAVIVGRARGPLTGRYPGSSLPPGGGLSHPVADQGDSPHA